ncbi:hypothetical protein HID58_083684 [Brassica napus]|uniref:Uncharacterized protein n=1 Tax=Brassica napus TaxID=3708 RepID=A0ABQ7YGM6_BRANA|nr:hypothetical protein HID58_083684 [Brassica napus]
MNTGQDEEPLPSTGTRGSGGTPPMAETNHGRTNLYKGSNRRAKTERHRLPETKTGEVGAMKAVASRRQSCTVIGGTDQP